MYGCVCVRACPSVLWRKIWWSFHFYIWLCLVNQAMITAGTCKSSVHNVLHCLRGRNPLQPLPWAGHTRISVTLWPTWLSSTIWMRFWWKRKQSWWRTRNFNITFELFFPKLPKFLSSCFHLQVSILSWLLTMQISLCCLCHRKEPLQKNLITCSFLGICSQKTSIFACENICLCEWHFVSELYRFQFLCSQTCRNITRKMTCLKKIPGKCDFFGCIEMVNQMAEIVFQFLNEYCENQIKKKSNFWIFPDFNF